MSKTQTLENIPEELYHYTKTINVPAILIEGLIPGREESEYCPPLTDTRNVWLDAFYYSPPNIGNSIIAIDTSKIDLSKIHTVEWNQEWFCYEGTIPSNALELAEDG